MSNRPESYGLSLTRDGYEKLKEYAAIGGISVDYALRQVFDFKVPEHWQDKKDNSNDTKKS